MSAPQTVLQVFKGAQDILAETTPSLRLRSAWLKYRGGEVPPFDAYIRWGYQKVILANFSYANDTGSQRGRMPVIMDALEGLAPNVIIESVINPHIRQFLFCRGYRMSDPEMQECTSMESSLAPDVPTNLTAV